jgi:AmiR/NasT family two-component response regulator
VATVGLLQERTTRQKELLAEKLQDALNLRVMIEQAKGVVAERSGLDVDEAFPLMQQYAEETGMPLSEVASRALNGTLDLSDGAQPA